MKIGALKEEIRYLLNRWPVILHDSLMVLIAWFLAYSIRFDLNLIPPPFSDQAIAMLPLVTAIQVCTFIGFGLHRGAWRFTSLPDAYVIGKAIVFGTAMVTICIFLLNRLDAIPRAVLPLYGVILFVLVGTNRVLYRSYRRRNIRLDVGRRALILGAGEAGNMLAQSLLQTSPRRYDVIGFLDDDPDKIGTDIQAIRVLGNLSDLQVLSKRLSIELIMIAIPSATSDQMRHIITLCNQSNIACRTLPGVHVLDGKVRQGDLRKLETNDLLSRESVSLQIEPVAQAVVGKCVLITGGAGSIGSELCRQVSRLNPSRLVILDQDEFSLYGIELEINREFPDIDLYPRLGDVCDEPAVRDVFVSYLPDLVFHAAAYKHVPMLEKQIRETIRNNVLGTEIVSRITKEHSCDAFVLISTDKAVNPSSTMGASKRVAEILVQARNLVSKTSFITVRFGNVLGSAGSVLPLFEKQIREGGPVTVTDRRVTRFFMTPSEACQLILQAIVLQEGDIYVLDMGEPVKIDDLARQVIRMSGFIPDTDIEIEYTGLRPGEKLYEELFHDEEVLGETAHKKIFLAESRLVDIDTINEKIEELTAACLNSDDEWIRQVVTQLVPEYR